MRLRDSVFLLQVTSVPPSIISATNKTLTINPGPLLKYSILPTPEKGLERMIFKKNYTFVCHQFLLEQQLRTKMKSKKGEEAEEEGEVAEDKRRSVQSIN